jgi:hypothetical protein
MVKLFRFDLTLSIPALSFRHWEKAGMLRLFASGSLDIQRTFIVVWMFQQPT